MGRKPAQALALAAGLGTAALLPLPFYLGIGILHWQQPWQIALLGSSALGIVLMAVWVVMAVQRMLGALPPATRGPAPRDWANEARRVRAWIGEDPARVRWQPLIERFRGKLDLDALLRFDQRYRELAAHPVRARYVEMLLDGDWRTDDEIDYRENPARVVTCAHLAPIERDLRRYGIRSAPFAGTERKLWTQANLALDRLAAHYDTASLRETVIEDHPHDPGTTLIECLSCGSFIDSRGSARFPPEAV